MPHLAPHLLLRANAAASTAGALLRAGGYIVSRIDDDALAEQLAGAPHVDGVVVELPALATIQFGRKLAARYGAGSVLVVAITPAVQTVQRAIPAAFALTPLDVENDLISTVDLALAERQRIQLTSTRALCVPRAGASANVTPTARHATRIA